MDADSINPDGESTQFQVEVFECRATIFCDRDEYFAASNEVFSGGRRATDIGEGEEVGVLVELNRSQSTFDWTIVMGARRRLNVEDSNEACFGQYGYALVER